VRVKVVTVMSDMRRMRWTRRRGISVKK